MHYFQSHPDEMLSETEQHRIRAEQFSTQHANINASHVQANNLNLNNKVYQAPNIIQRQGRQVISNSLKIVGINNGCGETGSGQVMSSPGSSNSGPPTSYYSSVQSDQPTSISLMNNGVNTNLPPVSSPYPVQNNKVYPYESSHQTQPDGWYINGKFFSKPNQSLQEPVQPVQNSTVDPYGNSQDIKSRGWTGNWPYISQKASTKSPIAFQKDVKTESNFEENLPSKPALSVQVFVYYLSIERI